MVTLKPGDEVRVVEHDDSTRSPLEGGDAYPAEVVAADSSYVRVRYSDGPLEGAADTFWAGSLWRAWDGWFRWRLQPVKAEEG